MHGKFITVDRNNINVYKFTPPQKNESKNTKKLKVLEIFKQISAPNDTEH